MTQQTKIKESCLEVKICGKIVGIEQIEGRNNSFYSNTIIIPSADEFSKPTRLVINSKLPFAEEGQIVEAVAHVVPQWRNKDGKWFFNCNLWKEKLGA